MLPAVSDDTLGGWPVAEVIPVAWGDMDAFGHVNNAVFLRWYESGRIAYFRQIFPDADPSFTRPEKIGPILARAEVNYRRPVAYPDVVTIEVSVTRIGKSSFTMSYRIKSRAQSDAVVADGEGIQVLYDYQTAEPVPIPDDLRAAIHAFETGDR